MRAEALIACILVLRPGWPERWTAAAAPLRELAWTVPVRVAGVIAAMKGISASAWPASPACPTEPLNRAVSGSALSLSLAGAIVATSLEPNPNASELSGAVPGPA